MNPAAFHGPIPKTVNPPDPALVACASWGTHFDEGYCRCLCTKCYNRQHKLCACPSCKHTAPSTLPAAGSDYQRCLAEGEAGIERILFGEPDYTPVPVAGQHELDSYIDGNGHIRVKGRRHQEARARQYLNWINKGKKDS